MQKQLFHTTDAEELGNYFFQDRLLDFPKYLSFLMMYVNGQNEQIEFIQAFVHLESQDGEKDEVLTVETVFFNTDKTKILRIWGAKDIESGVALLVTMDVIDSVTKEIEKQYKFIENDVELFREPIDKE
ncbi:hypothetical protein JMM81_11570 [Bacillus sp. V3B]|uniref:hypothetical protein n=1 Tax=Bacillus sp. V3B TaxID=2804915 RepID=UPI00210DC36B|nr:hypothetical protein [Bacillus sp. V3B]MCQ6275596.1 hypothetical protein [Bacillus sp. V3B]